MDRLVLYGTIATVLVGVVLGGYQLIKKDAERLAESEQVKENLTAIGERIKDNAILKDFSLPALCRELNGVWVEDECK